MPRIPDKTAHSTDISWPGWVPEPGGRLRVAVVYPGLLGEGSSSLALSALLDTCQRAGAAAELVFAGQRSGRPPRSLPSGRLLTSFELLAVSVAYEEQWPVLLGLLADAGIPLRADRRGLQHPLLLVGGVAARLNPAPVLPFVDLLAPGEAETVLPELLEALAGTRGTSRDAQLSALAQVPGLGAWPFERVPIHCRFSAGVEPVVGRIETVGSTFGDLLLVETGRGCPAGCRFCAIGFARRPPLFFSAQQIAAALSGLLTPRRRVGLVGASLGRHPELGEILDRLGVEQADLSPASLDITALEGSTGERLLAALRTGGQRTVTLAPEAGSERLRRSLNKPLADEAIMQAARRLGEAGVVHLKLYFMYGLPGEQAADLDALIELTRRLREGWSGAHRCRGGTGRLTLSLNPFIPKPHTPFEDLPLEPLAELERRRRRLASGLRRLGGVHVGGFSPRAAQAQALLARGGGELAGLLEACAGRWPPPAGLLRRWLPDWQERLQVPSATRPWRLVETGVEPAWLVGEARRAQGGLTTPACEPEGCRACGACPPGGALDDSGNQLQYIWNSNGCRSEPCRCAQGEVGRFELGGANRRGEPGLPSY